MAIFRNGTQDYATVAEVKAETVTPRRNDEIKIEELDHRSFDWWVGATTAGNDTTVIEQASDTSGRWVSSTGLTSLTGTFDSPALANGQMAIETVLAPVTAGNTYVAKLKVADQYPEGVTVTILDEVVTTPAAGLKVKIENFSDQPVPAIAGVEVVIVEIPAA